MSRLVRIMGGVLASAALCGVAIACGHSYAADDPAAADAGDASPTTSDEASADSAAHEDAAVIVDAADAGDGGRNTIGCADGTRESFLMNEGGIAACEGAWSIPGVFVDGGLHCGRHAGNDTSGVGCGAQDLCAEGWHVCADYVDVLLHGGASGGVCSSTATMGHTFFATAQPSLAAAMCQMSGGTGTNDVFGCGDIGSLPSPSCAPLNCVASSGSEPADFDFGGSLSEERANVIKASGLGGVLCCSD